MDGESHSSQHHTQFSVQRQQMVERQLRSRDITDERILDAFQRVPRHQFVPEKLHERAYNDRPLPIGNEQTISQPYIVALMTQLAQPQPKSRALDIGTGSGYQAAILAELVQDVYTIEIVDALAQDAKQRLLAQGYKNIQFRSGDGYQGWPEAAPFDVIIVAASPDHVPAPLIEQLAPGGRLVIPVGNVRQELRLIEKDEAGNTEETTVAPVSFVPMTGEAMR